MIPCERFKQALERHTVDLTAIGIKPMVMMTWAWEGKPEMTKQLADATTTAANENNIMVVPAGLAFAEALRLNPNLKLYRPDHFHPSAIGTYLAGCVLYATMFHRTPVGLNFYGVDPVEPETAKFLQQVAWDTTTEFFSWKK